MTIEPSSAGVMLIASSRTGSADHDRPPSRDRALPRATYTDPELAFVGFSLEQAQAQGRDAFELVADFPTTAKGYSVEATFGHVTVVVDRESHELLGAAMAAPDASAAIHECVVAIKARLPIELLADTIHAFPSTSRIFNGLFNDAAEMLAGTIAGAEDARARMM
jgi:pyruvate/2-oxoglutarate dehydrogenase complex dihydrolipoamide dehydrogenase (E3) component